MESDHIKLKRMLSGWDGATSMICSIIGSGISVSPKAVPSNVGSPGMSLVIWWVSGLISLVQAFIYAELVFTFPEAGSEYVFIRQGFGNYLAFFYMWIATVFQQSASRAIVSLTLSTYLCQVIWSDC
ncbi:Y+L amino acid transporter 2-like [Tigriopus californicus]|uniref:Y+L amino acid transporter 2-like n=1 Tax=Tigriopus californicus TaxID=6832 RepID=UPI0027DA9E75|nr:Y+L amino acid transporter 2-like [Tigriopus californicus]